MPDVQVDVNPFTSPGYYYNLLMSQVRGVEDYFSTELELTYDFFVGEEHEARRRKREEERGDVRFFDEGLIHLQLQTYGVLRIQETAKSFLGRDVKDILSELYEHLDAKDGLVRATVFENRRRYHEQAMAFLHLVASFEGVLSEYYQILVGHDIELLKTEEAKDGRVLTYNEIVVVESLSEIQERIIHKATKTFASSAMQEWDRLQTLNACLKQPTKKSLPGVKLQFLPQELVGCVVEIFAMRNLHAHGRGVFSDAYNQKVDKYYESINHNKENKGKRKIPHGKMARKERTVGSYCEIDHEYMTYVRDTFKVVNDTLSYGIIDKYVSDEEQHKYALSCEMLSMFNEGRRERLAAQRMNEPGK